MFHDLLISLFQPNSKMMDMYKLIATADVTANFLHPSEVEMLSKIVEVIDNFRKIEDYINSVKSADLLPDPEDKAGLYLQAFANGLDVSLNEYRKTIVDTERRYLQNPHNSMAMIYVVVYPCNRLMECLLKMIREINAQKIVGCSILQYLHKYQFDCENSKAIQIIQNSLQLVFNQQLSQWLIYGRLVDKYEEFFIVRQDVNLLTFMDQPSKITTTGSATTTTTQSKEVANFSQYELSYEHLPPFIDRNTAEDILFIGQTVIKFNSHDRTEGDPLELRIKTSFWGEFEVKFFSCFAALLTQTETLKLGRFHQIIAEMKKYVTEHLYQIAKRDSDLLHQLKLIKDYFLLGRGDQYEEFIKECRMLSGQNHLALHPKDLNRAFQIAAQSLNIGEDLDQFSFCLADTNVSEAQNATVSVDETLSHISMRYKVKWPLHMIFSLGVMERYNDIFRFLLRIKKAQHDLQLVWTLHREQKRDKSHAAVQLRNKLMFFIDNMFMYLQVDVIESRFNALEAAIRACEDFLVIQKEHSVFQIMILSHCFLMGAAGGSNQTRSEKVHESEVLMNLQRILCVVHVFSEWQLNEDDASFEAAQVPGMNSIEGLSDQFDSLIKDFMLRLMGLKSGPNGMPLTQLLLRLNFNYNYARPQ